MKMIDLKISKYLNLLRYSTKRKYFNRSRRKKYFVKTQSKVQFLLTNKGNKTLNKIKTFKKKTYKKPIKIKNKKN